MVGKSKVLPTKTDCGLKCYLEKFGVFSIGLEEVWMKIPFAGRDIEFILWEFVLWEWNVTGNFAVANNYIKVAYWKDCSDNDVKNASELTGHFGRKQ